MTDAPPVPPDADLRGVPFYMLDVTRLLNSDLYALSTGDEFKAALSLWMRSLLQVPAGSLPDDERILAYLSGAGPNWPAVRDMALRGWQRHSDGRLYHAVVTERVVAVLSGRQAMIEGGRRGARKRWHRDSDAVGVASPSHGHPIATPMAHPMGFDSKKKEKYKLDTSSLRSDDAVPASVHPVTLPRNVRDELWQAGLPIIRELTGLPEAKARAMLGRMLKAAGDDCAKVLRVLREAADTRPVDPAAWLMAACKPQTGNPFLAVARDAAAQRAPPMLIEGLAAIEKMGGRKE